MGFRILLGQQPTGALNVGRDQVTRAFTDVMFK